MTTRTKALLFGALVIGVTTGAAAAVLTQSDEPSTASKATVTLPPVEPVRVQNKPEAPRGDTLLRVDRDSIRIESQQPDPRGGPAWAVRTYSAARVIRPKVRRPGVNPVVGHSRCAQIGRIYRGRFGWINPKGVFRPRALGTDWVTSCRSQRSDRAGKPIVRYEALIADPDQGASAVYGSVVWGLAGRGAKSASLRLGEKRSRVAIGKGGSFLRLEGADLRQAQVALDVRRRDGTVGQVSLAPRRAFPGGARLPPEIRKRLRKQFAAHPVGVPSIEVRTPDPAGGLPWGLSAARSSTGGWCLSQPARVIGDRVGNPKPRAGTMDEAPIGFGCVQSAPLTRARPVTFGWTYMRASAPGDAARRSATRAQNDRIVVHGTAARDVKYVTIATPRDVRTLVPSKRAHAFLVVYDDSFPTGNIVVTSTFTDGKTRETKIDARPF